MCTRSLRFPAHRRFVRCLCGPDGVSDFDALRLITLHDELLAVMERRETAMLRNCHDRFTTLDAFRCTTGTAGGPLAPSRVAHPAMKARLYSLMASRSGIRTFGL